MEVEVPPMNEISPVAEYELYAPSLAHILFAVIVPLIVQESSIVQLLKFPLVAVMFPEIVTFEAEIPFAFICEAVSLPVIFAAATLISSAST